MNYIGNTHKYDKKIILKYIYNKNTYPHKKEDLENDSNFMKSVISITNNKKYYRNCSKEIKKNYNFIKFLIETFPTDIAFIKQVVKYYLQSKDILEEIDIKLLLEKHNINYDSIFNTSLDINYLYNSYIKQIYNVIKEEIDITVITELGKGFIFIQEEFKNYENILEYFAKNFLFEIFYEENTLEDIIHRKFKDIKNIEKIGINNFLIEYIKNYDVYLSNYMSLHKYLLKGIILEIEKIKNNWDFYNENLREKRKKIITKKINEFKNSLPYEVEIDYYRITCDILKKYNIEDFKEFEINSENKIKNEKVINIMEVKFILFIKELIKEIYLNDYTKKEGKKIIKKQL